MDENEFEPADDVSLKTVLDAVNRQSKNIEAIVEAKENEKNRCLERWNSWDHSVHEVACEEIEIWRTV